MLRTTEKVHAQMQKPQQEHTRGNRSRWARHSAFLCGIRGAPDPRAWMAPYPQEAVQCGNTCPLP